MTSTCIEQTNENKKEYKSERFQHVFETIKKERPWDIRPVNSVYTTAKEKYLIELISKENEISDETIDHVVGGCYRIHNLTDSWICWFGFILTKEENMQRCKYAEKSRSNSKVNSDLWSSQGTLFYPVDMLVNPFGEWQPREGTLTKEIEEVHELVKLRWPSPWYEDELHKYTLKYLMKLIENGNVVSREIKEHVVHGCDSDFHTLDENYKCCKGFVLKNEEVPISLWGNRYTDVNQYLCWRHDAFHLKKDPSYYQLTGVKSIPLSELRFRKYQTSECLTYRFVKIYTEASRSVYNRIIHRDLASPRREKFQITWTEQNLIDQMNTHSDIPTEVTSHSLEGCYTLCHMLTEKYACCRGYIVESKTILEHHCSQNHEISKDLRCYFGQVHHSCAEIPRRPSPKLNTTLITSLMMTKIKGAGYITGLKSVADVNEGEVPSARCPSRPAPPPPDHLDELRNIDALHLQQNEAEAHLRNNNDVVDMEVEPIVQNAEVADLRPRLRAASPPPEIEI